MILTPPGPGTAHQIINTSKSRLLYLALSVKRRPEVCYYPDSGKYGAYFGEGREDAFIAMGESAVDYWLDEIVEPRPPFFPESGD